MICPYCGKENPEDTKVCFSCGGSLEVAGEQSTPETHPPELISNAQSPEHPQQESSTPTTQPPARTSKRAGGNRIWWLVGCILLVALIVVCAGAFWGLYAYTDTLIFLHPDTPTPTLTPTLTPTFTPTPTLTPTITPSPTPTFTPSPSPTNTLPPPTPTFSLGFFDDFSDTSSGWESLDYLEFSADYYNEAYRILVKTDNIDTWSIQNDYHFIDLSIEVDAFKNGGPDDNDLGVICRYHNDDEFYFGIITSDGYYGIMKMTRAGGEVLGRETLAFSNLIKQGAFTNHIRFDCIGSALILYVNGQQLDKQTDDDYSSGNVGLIVGTWDVAGVDILFDNFYVYAP